LLPADAPPESGIWDCIVSLTHSYRYEAESGIGKLAAAINQGAAGAVLEMLQSGAGGVALGPLGEDGGVAWLQSRAVAGFAPYLRESDAAVQMRALERFRVLCAHRRGSAGVETINVEIERGLAEAGLIEPGGQSYYAGRPLMITRNDYSVRLFNGDIGLVVREPGTSGARAFFAAEGGPRLLSPSRLPPHETVFAMSVHKSQGSEFDSVIVLLPPRISPVISRELLYTAVTRARQSVTICGAPEVIRAAVERRIERASGLREALWDNGAPD
jgi:exodeoxyribonuclease V alpha subunit